MVNTLGLDFSAAGRMVVVNESKGNLHVMKMLLLSFADIIANGAGEAHATAMLPTVETQER